MTIGYSEKNKVIFIHVPKTAGSSIREAVGIKNSHTSLINVKKNITEKQFDDYFKFSVVRNPWARLYSYYNYRRKRWTIPSYGKLAYEKNFNDWVLECFNEYKKSKDNNNFLNGQVATLCDPNPRTPFRLWEPQCKWFMIDGKICLDYVIKFEDLENDWKFCSDKIFGKHKKLNHLKKTNKKREYIKAYNLDSIKMVEEMFSLDIKLFNYNFEN